MKEKIDASKGSKKDQVYAVNEKRQGGDKGHADADIQQHAKQEHEKRGHQQGDGHASIEQIDMKNSGRDSQQHAHQGDGNHKGGGSQSPSKSNQQGNHADDRPRARGKSQQR